ncbi:uncharacterized protein NESG_01948 [Nematocida ausubeli]|uniref:SH2 domain-containing protein n=1 Tax=Nematocida ausubeli (strain ATCC PRA-371 / ERTm2) TaxID=1913371 RepID=A0A086J1E0_NEMA1|nr:uncharacterized protein NESG_01948 [Nematocida ausubeli]KFG25958.1 hypothetical protein NESG_01948 [Nematocida ausubeli]
MKREREEESDDEIIERRRKVHKKDKDIKDEIEDLFEEISSDQTAENIPQANEWRVTGSATAGALQEIFGDGTDYLYAMEYYTKKNEQEEKRHKEFKQPKPEVFSKIDREEIISRVTESLMETNTSFPKHNIEAVVGNIVDNISLVDTVSESFHCLDSRNNHITLLEARRLVALYREKDKILAHLPKVLDKNIKTVISCAHMLKTPEEYTRLVRYVYRLQSNECTDADREIAANVTQKITNISMYYTEYAAVNSDDQQIRSDPEDKGTSHTASQKETKLKISRERGLLHNPWIYRAAVEIGMEISTVEIQGIENIKILASAISQEDMFLLNKLTKRGISYRIILNKEETVRRISQKLDGSAPMEEIVEGLSYFIDKSADDISAGIEKELISFAEEYVKIELFKTLINILSIKPGKEDILSIWIDKGKTRYTKVNSKGTLISSGIVTPREDINISEHKGIVALTGCGYRLKPYTKGKYTVYIQEEVLSLVGGSKDMSVVMCNLIRNPLSALESLLSSDAPVPRLVLLQSMLPQDVPITVLQYAVAYKKAETQMHQSAEYSHLKKDVMEFLKGGGDPEAVIVDRYAECDVLRRAVKETAVSGAGWKCPETKPVLENILLRDVYTHCVNKMENIHVPVGLPDMSPDEAFLAFNRISEEDLLYLQTKWTLSCGVVISMPGMETEGIITGLRQETHLRLDSGVSAVLSGKVRPGVVDGQRLSVTVLGLDMLQYRAIVQEKQEKVGLRAHSNWRVKNVTAKAAGRMLRERPFGSYILRPSATHLDSLILTVRITEVPEKFLLSHIRVREVPSGYEVAGKVFGDLDGLVETYIPNYLRTFKRVMHHRKFTTEPVDAIKTRLLHAKAEDALDKYALSISKTAPGCVSFVYVRNKSEPTEVLLHVVEQGLYFDRKVYAKPEDFINMIKKSQAK